MRVEVALPAAMESEKPLLAGPLYSAHGPSRAPDPIDLDQWFHSQLMQTEAWLQIDCQVQQDPDLCAGSARLRLLLWATQLSVEPVQQSLSGSGCWRGEFSRDVVSGEPEQ